MVSQVMLAQIDKRMRQATGQHNLFFGGINVILIGDPGQLLPVGGSALYIYPTKSVISSHGLNCYKQFQHAICLEKSERQQNLNNDPDQEYFIKLLNRLRCGMTNLQQNLLDWTFLLKNQIKPNRNEEFKDAIRLFADNASCNKYNGEMIKKLGMPICKINAINKPARGKNYNDDQFSGLKNFINLAINVKVTLTSNLWTTFGLVNGANGTVKDIIYANNYIPNDLPKAIFIEFDYYTGPKFFPENDHRHSWIPINPLDIYSQSHGTNRIQYPIRLSYALTIHKSQGQTIEKAVIDLGKAERSLGLTFVALSRLKNFSDFLISPFTLERLNKIGESASLKPRLDEEIRILLIVNKTKQDFNFLM